VRLGRDLVVPYLTRPDLWSLRLCSTACCIALPDLKEIRRADVAENMAMAERRIRSVFDGARLRVGTRAAQTRDQLEDTLALSLANFQNHPHSFQDYPRQLIGAARVPTQLGRAPLAPLDLQWNWHSPFPDEKQVSNERRKHKRKPKSKPKTGLDGWVRWIKDQLGGAPASTPPSRRHLRSRRHYPRR
jgi:hypothetical protein